METARSDATYAVQILRLGCPAPANILVTSLLFLSIFILGIDCEKSILENNW
jgi:hypothetical protein